MTLQRYAPVGALLVAIATCVDVAQAQVISDGTMLTPVLYTDGCYGSLQSSG
jgi:hypothetical protein